MNRAKVAVIGAGNVGATVAARLVADEVADVVLVDVIEGMPQGKALDLAEATPVGGTSVDVSGSNDYGAIALSDVVVVTAGIARKPGMSRDDLLATNAGIVKSAAEQVRAKAPGAFVVVVTNPLDVMTYLAWKVTGFPRARVFGMAGVLDSTRFAYFVSRELGVAARDVAAMVLGGHGDTMVPLPRYTTVSGIPITDLLSPEAIATLVARTRDGGAEIVGLLRQGSAFYAPGAAAAAMVKSLLRDEKRLLPAAAILEGEFGEHDVCLGVPLVIGAGGAERIVELKLTHEEKAALRKSADAVREGIGVLRARGAL
jgi:malate dehydrogenase